MSKEQKQEKGYTIGGTVKDKTKTVQEEKKKDSK